MNNNHNIIIHIQIMIKAGLLTARACWTSSCLRSCQGSSRLLPPMNLSLSLSIHIWVCIHIYIYIYICICMYRCICESLSPARFPAFPSAFLPFFLPQEDPVRFDSLRFRTFRKCIGLVRFGSEICFSRSGAVRPALFERVVARSGSVPRPVPRPVP